MCKCINKRIRWRKGNKGNYPDNFINFICEVATVHYKIDISELIFKDIHPTAEEFEYALHTIGGLSRRILIVEDYFKNKMNISELSEKYEVSEKVIRYDIHNILRIFINSKDTQSILLTGESTSSDNMRKEDILKLGIEQTNLIQKDKNALRRNGIHTIEDLIKYSLYDLNHMKNIGRQAQEHVVILLNRYDLSLKDCNREDIRKFRNGSKYKLSHSCGCIIYDTCKNRICDERMI